MCCSFHEGRNLLGATFKKAHVSFEESVLKPYVEFLNQIYRAYNFDILRASADYDLVQLLQCVKLGRYREA